MAVQTTTTYTDLPDELKKFYKDEAKERGRGLDLASDIYDATKEYVPYQGPRVADLSQDERVAQDMAGGLDEIMGRYVQPDTGADMRAMGERVMGNVVDGGASKFLNPYLDEVVNATAADLDFDLKQALNQNSAAAAAKGSLRGSGLAVNNALTQGEFARAKASELGQLRAQGFDKAMGYGLRAAGQAQDMAGQQVDDAVRMGRAGLDAATTEIDARSAAGSAERGLEQAGYDIAYEDHLDQIDYPRRAFDWWQQTLPGSTYSGAGVYEGQTRQRTDTGDPNRVSQAIGLMTAASGLF